MLLFFSCTSNKRIEKQKQNSKVILINEGPWKTNFKNMVFTNILYKFYGKEFKSCCLSKDASGTANFDWLNYDTTVYNVINTLSDNFVKKYNKGSEIEGVPVKMNFALEYRLSNELDSLTKKYFKQYFEKKGLTF